MAAFAAGQHEVLNNLIILNEPHLTGQVWDRVTVSIWQGLLSFGLQGQHFAFSLKLLNLLACLVTHQRQPSLFYGP
jgi:type III secretory pathway component EscS